MQQSIRTQPPQRMNGPPNAKAPRFPDDDRRNDSEPSDSAPAGDTAKQHSGKSNNKQQAKSAPNKQEKDAADNKADTKEQEDAASKEVAVTEEETEQKKVPELIHNQVTSKTVKHLPTQTVAETGACTNYDNNGEAGVWVVPPPSEPNHVTTNLMGGVPPFMQAPVVAPYSYAFPPPPHCAYAQASLSPKRSLSPPPLGLPSYYAPYTSHAPPPPYAHATLSSNARSLSPPPDPLGLPSYYAPMFGGFHHDNRSTYNENDKDKSTLAEPVVTKIETSDSIGVETTATGGLLLNHPDGRPMALVDCLSTDLATLFRQDKLRVTSMLTESDSKKNSPKNDSINGESAPKNTRRFRRWTEAEDDTLREAIDACGGNDPIDWRRISRKYFKGSRTGVQCKNRWKKFVQPGLKRTPFSEEEDQMIRSAMEQNASWTDIAAMLEGRPAERIRNRWINFLDPSLTKAPWTDEENAILFRAQAEKGNKWFEISQLLPGRSENAVKNRFHNAKVSQRRMMKRLAKQAQVAEQLKAVKSEGTAHGHSSSSESDWSDEES